MAVACLVFLGRFIMNSVGESTNFLVSDCCSDRLILSDSCPVDMRCSPGCYQVWTNNGSFSCIKCTNETGLDVFQNLTACRLGNPGVAASLLLGTLFISLFLVFSVASFFYLKRSHLLPEIFYRRNKASIFQPNEMASMIPEPNTSGRKPRYVRRERTHKAAAPVLLDPSADMQISNV
ncbi:uncharacterized protein C1orf159 homolog isoform X4 [Hyla sarda]|uniref:uncharacterized protein C1orf159 homolog isoform X4 n=1 Tax=Hyla sarda TaxID=327740 RepID=UPI0024C43200|nr:uncharacterized protein C1orf159 homolog isoform X4 [Hyla sarda]